MHIPVGITNVELTCSLPECVWIISNHSSVIIITQTYTIPEIYESFNTSVSLMRTNNTNISYTTAHINIYGQVTIPSVLLISTAVVSITVIIVLALFATLISLFIFLHIRKRKSTNTEKQSDSGNMGNLDYETLSEIAPKESIQLPFDLNQDYMAIDETHVFPMEPVQQHNKRAYQRLASEQSNETDMMEKVENTPSKPVPRYMPINFMEENGNFVSKSFTIKEFPAIYQRYVTSGIERDSLFSLEFESLNQDSKNSTEDTVLFDENMVVLDSIYSNCDYSINASWIESYQFIATINPIKETHQDFLQMIYQTQASMVIMLTTRKEKAKIIGNLTNRVCYWPKKDKPIHCEPFVTTLVNSTETNAFIKQKISLENTLESNEHHFTQLISQNWNEDCSVAEMSLSVSLLNRIIKQIRDDPTKPIIIHCKDGISKTGIILTAICSVKELTLKKTIYKYSPESAPYSFSVYANSSQC